MKNNQAVINFLSDLINNHNGVYLKNQDCSFYTYVDTESSVLVLEISGKGQNVDFILSGNSDNQPIVFSLAIADCRDLLNLVRIKYCLHNKIFCEATENKQLDNKNLILEEIEDIKSYLKTYHAASPIQSYSTLEIKSKNGYKNKLFIGKLQDRHQLVKQLSSVGLIIIECKLACISVAKANALHIRVIIPCEDLHLYPEIEKITKKTYSSHNINDYIEKLKIHYPELSKKLLYYNLENNNEDVGKTKNKNKI